MATAAGEYMRWEAVKAWTSWKKTNMAGVTVMCGGDILLLRNNQFSYNRQSSEKMILSLPGLCESCFKSVWNVIMQNIIRHVVLWEEGWLISLKGKVIVLFINTTSLCYYIPTEHNNKLMFPGDCRMMKVYGVWWWLWGCREKNATIPGKPKQ